MPSWHLQLSVLLSKLNMPKMKLLITPTKLSNLFISSTLSLSSHKVKSPMWESILILPLYKPAYPTQQAVLSILSPKYILSFLIPFISSVLTHFQITIIFYPGIATTLKGLCFYFYLISINAFSTQRSE